MHLCKAFRVCSSSTDPRPSVGIKIDTSSADTDRGTSSPVRNHEKLISEVTLLQVVAEHLGHAIGQGAHAVGAKAERAAAADAFQLADHFGQALGGLDGRGQAQGVRDQPANGFRDGGGVGAGLGGVDEDLEGLAAAVFVDGDKGLAQRGLDGVGEAGQVARARLLGLVPDVQLLAARLRWGRHFGAGRWPGRFRPPCFFSTVARVSSTTLSREPVT
jgi:hypothetical protein